MRTLGIVAAMVLFSGGIAMAIMGLRNSRRSGVARLRAALGAQEQISAEDGAPLAAVWAQLTRAADGLGKGTDLFTKLDHMLDQAGWLLRPAEFLVLAGLVGLGGGLLGSVLLSVGIGTVLGVVVAVGILYFLTSRRARKLRDRVDAQLPDVLGQLASSMRAGFSLTQAIEAVAESSAPPLATQLARVVGETQVGRPLDEALTAMAERVGSTDLRWTVKAMIIQSRTGGRLSDILDVLSEFMRDREEVRREVAALTADGRISALVLSGLPFFMVGLLLLVQPDYLLPLFQEPLGRVMVLGAGVMMVIGLAVMRRMVKVEI